MTETAGALVLYGAPTATQTTFNDGLGNLDFSKINP